ncbi:hypothetical protein B0J11DRAFT_253692 [Dendryphion nanum]|uniref:WKF domain-containing protein n=1 Tax=Dendryphion nanum TaxID=256645 RepID=A0A9P9E321_9PLEO|nr:hypothetical protein B0J11DRAFT_253692 [Dendryphion nanum]
MDQAGHRIPAWKRLGLKLKASNQSGDTAPELNGPKDSAGNENQNGNLNGEHHGESGGPRDSIHLDARPTENGISSSLGKRKHLKGPAEDQHQSPKKSKKYGNQETNNGDATYSTHVSSIETHPTSVPTVADDNTELPSDKIRPKGDPNYRKKKVKQTKFRPLQQGQATKKSESLLPTTEIDLQPSPSLTTPKPSKHVATNFTRDSASATLQFSPSGTDRRKSVTFTPDTKKVDGDSASNFFKKWVTEQKSADAGFSPAEVAQFVPPPKTHPANGISASPHSVSSKDTPKAKKAKTSLKSEIEYSPISPKDAIPEAPVSAPDSKTPSKGKNKDFSRFTSYLEQYFFDRENWKFNKARQNDIITNAFNIFRIPHKYTEALTEYVRGLQGAAIVNRLKERCEEMKKELDAEDRVAKGIMTDVDEREIARLEALEDRIAQGWKRRQTNGDLEELANHPHPEGFIRRLKRRRIESLCEALKMATPNPAHKIDKSENRNTSLDANTGPLLVAQARNSRKRKSRTEESDDDDSE